MYDVDTCRAVQRRWRILVKGSELKPKSPRGWTCLILGHVHDCQRSSAKQGKADRELQPHRIVL